MEDPMEGRCNCGAITVTVNPLEAPLKVSLCHCLDCRAPGGTLFAVNQLIPASNVRIEGSIPPKTYSTKAASGRTSNRHFCPQCGSPICTTVTEMPDVTFVKGGLFRGAGFELPQPFKEQWWRHAELCEQSYVSEDKIVH